MRNICIFITTCLLICTDLFAQKVVVVTPVTKQMSRGMQPGYMISIPDAKTKDIKSAFKKYLETNSKARAKEINGETIIYGAMNSNFSTKPFIIYSKMLETTEGVDVTAFVTEDSVTFIDESAEAD